MKFRRIVSILLFQLCSFYHSFFVAFTAKTELMKKNIHRRGRRRKNDAELINATRLERESTSGICCFHCSPPATLCSFRFREERQSPVDTFQCWLEGAEGSVRKKKKNDM